MNSFLLLATLNLSQSAPVDRSTPGKAIGAMFKRYFEAGSLSGRIRMTQTAEGRTLAIETYVQYRRPADLYIRQQKGGQSGFNLTIADGKTVTFEVPPEMPGRPGERLYSPQRIDGKPTMQIQDCYTMAINSLWDRSPILDACIAKTAYLTRLKGQWATLEYPNGNVPEEGESAVIVGDYRDFQKAPVTGSFQMTISPQGDFSRLTIREKFAVPNVKEPILIMTTWEADLKVNDPGDEKLYKVVR